MNTIATFRKCTLSDDELIGKIDKLVDEIYQTGRIPSRNIPARPNDDFDLLVGELLIRYTEVVPYYDCRPAVKWFANEMEAKLTENNHKGGWKNCPHSYLLDKLKKEVAELEKALSITDNQKHVIREAADVANYALMIADLAGKLYGK